MQMASGATGNNVDTKENFLHALCRGQRQLAIARLEREGLDLGSSPCLDSAPLGEILDKVPPEKTQKAMKANTDRMNPIDLLLLGHISRCLSHTDTANNKAETFGSAILPVASTNANATLTSNPNDDVREENLPGVKEALNALLAAGVPFRASSPYKMTTVRFATWLMVDFSVSIKEMASLLLRFYRSNSIFLSSVCSFMKQIYKGEPQEFQELVSTILDADLDSVRIRLRRLAKFWYCLVVEESQYSATSRAKQLKYLLGSLDSRVTPSGEEASVNNMCAQELVDAVLPYLDRLLTMESSGKMSSKVLIPVVNIAVQIADFRLVKSFLRILPSPESLGWSGVPYSLTLARCPIVAALLLQHGFDVNYQDGRGWTPLMHAVNKIIEAKNPTDDINKCMGVWEILMGHQNFNPNLKDLEGKTVLMHSLSSKVGVGWLLQRLLAETDIDVNARDNRGQSALCIAFERFNFVAVVELLRRPNVDPNITVGANEPLLHAMISYVIEIRALEKQSGRDAEAARVRKYQEMLWALKHLVRHPKVQVNVLNQNGETALHRAITEHLNSVLATLLQSPHIDVNLKNHNSGATALHSAIRSDNIAATRLLLKQPTLDADLTDDEGHKAQCNAERSSQSEHLRLIRTHTLQQAAADDMEKSSKYMDAILSKLESSDPRLASVVSKIKRLQEDVRRRKENKKTSDDSGQGTEKGETYILNLPSEDTLSLMKAKVDQIPSLLDRDKEDIFSHMRSIEAILKRDLPTKGNGMSQARKDALVRNRVFLCDEMNPQELFDFLIQSDVLTADHVEMIRLAGTRRGMCERLLDMLRTRDDEAFDALLGALVETKQTHIARQLEGGIMEPVGL